jgi:lipoyl-dependent peroxiredoxin
MSKHFASARWEGNLAKGKGKYLLKTSGHEGKYGFTTRFEDDKSQSSPEELIGAAHASCFSMALSHGLDQAGFTPDFVETEAVVTLSKTDGGFVITNIHLKTRAGVPGISKEQFMEQADGAKKNCPVSKALQATDITMEAELV